ncbi:hypothetical protein C7212DRAFT_341801 [Tuber magnatum]|uniref:ADF-H domain-containing protein n=1 Tax=Tuber magnatum TaxID=42249 RepID=A0A317T284_9PEZI|nr:hypothetical protein C7212DRAFT_341801 [Tuber magnatum]
MSLNGLDSPQLTEAFEKACAEPGGCFGFLRFAGFTHAGHLARRFWIKYTSRDDVELLCRGNNGSEEMREASSKEPNDSPLYGFIRFRRRNILIKYIPQETSRVLKARSTVHFQSIVERFNPHDTEITITCPKELRDHALTSACSTHTATASVSSSNSSVRQRRLTDIAESADEEDPSKTTINPGPLAPLGKTDEEGEGSQGLAVVITTHGPKSPDGGPGSPVFLEEDGDRLVAPRSPTFPSGEELRRKSTNSIRPSPTDIYEYPYTPKVRLGPRPHIESQKRPHTSSERSRTFPSPGEEVRPVASVPKSVQIAPRKSSASSVRTKSLTSESVKSIPISPAPGISQRLPSPVASPPTILPPPSPPQPEGPPVLSPEKQRLMRALQLRRQTMVPEVKEHVKPDDAPPEDLLVNVKEKDEAKSIESQFEEDVASSKPAIEREPVETSQESVQDSEKELDASTDQGEIDINTGAAERGSRSTEAENTEHHHIHQSGGPTSVNEEQQAESTKVRGEPESDAETESDQSVEVSIAESRSISVKPVQQPLPNVVKSIYHTAQPTPKPTSPVVAPSQTVPRVLKRAERAQPERVPPTEIPVIETARSVSAPFLKSARETTKPAVVRKVNVGGGGSVLQRIRQLEMLSVSEGGTAVPPTSPPRTRNTSPTPAFPPRPSSVHSNPPIRTLSSPAPQSTSYISPTRTQTAPVIESPSQDPVPPLPPKLRSLPKIEIIERNNRPELQVTTTITRDESPVALPSSNQGKVVDSPRNSPKQGDNSSPLLDPSPTRRSSVDIGSVHSQNSSRRPSVDRPTPSISSSPKDLENLPEGRPSSTSSKKSKGVKSRRSSSSSLGSSHRPNRSPTTPKSPKPSVGFLRRMSSSLSRKTKEVAAEVISAAAPTPVPAPAPAPVPEPARSARKTCLLAGWINVQLPDTMADGWLFLSPTDDENSPQTRKYYIPDEIRTVDLPDVDEQELPHSVRLFLETGGTLQCACQNGSEQKEILGAIRGCAI